MSKCCGNLIFDAIFDRSSSFFCSCELERNKGEVAHVGLKLNALPGAAASMFGAHPNLVPIFGKGKHDKSAESNCQKWHYAEIEEQVLLQHGPPGMTCSLVTKHWPTLQMYEYSEICVGQQRV